MTQKTKFIKGQDPITIIGAGLAGSECAWQLAEKGHKVILIEMRGSSDDNGQVNNTPAHKTELFAELVCSNSLGSQTDYSATGQMKWEAMELKSLILKAAREASVPAGMALAVDRDVFSKLITDAIYNHPRITVEKRKVTDINSVSRPTVVATGPLTDNSLANSILSHLNECFDCPGTLKSNAKNNDYLYFFDAIAPIIDVDSINMDVAWLANRHDKSSDGDTTKVDSSELGAYINCPMEKDQYLQFIDAIKNAKKIEPKEFEKDTPYFESCMPIEAIIERGPMTPRFGPMSSKGLENPKTKTRPFAVVQLRQENKEATAYGMVGFQTKMAYGEQKRIFSMIPGLENAEFLKLGSIHRNMFIHSPRKLTPSLSSKIDPWLFFAGQITGVEGYFDSTCIGLLVAKMLDEQFENEVPHFSIHGELMSGYFNPPPKTTAFGALLKAITEPKVHFQPTNINFGLFPPPLEENRKLSKEAKRHILITQSKKDFTEWMGN
jgi:methylenetetrahydrofolate--tRNA-(uracil-5-)-methyltransferase